MRHGVPTCKEPKDPGAIYLRNMYHEFFWGPFANEEEATKAVIKLDKADSYWDYEPFCIIFGKDPLPEDFVFGFLDVPEEMRERIYTRKFKE